MPGSFDVAGGSATPPGRPAAADPGSIQTRFEVDQTQPTTSVQVRLADGTKWVAPPSSLF